MTYAELTQQIQDYVQSDEATFLSNLDSIIQIAEQRINRDVKSPDSRVTYVGSLVTQTITTPQDFVIPLSLFVEINGVQTGMLLKEVSYLTEAFGVTEQSAGSSGEPVYYAIERSNTTGTYLLVAPSPDAIYPYTLYYYRKPETIVSVNLNNTTWISEYFPQVLLYGCLAEAYTFLKGDPQMQQQYEKLYQLGILELKNVCEDDQRMDNFRNPDSKRNIG